MPETHPVGSVSSMTQLRLLLGARIRALTNFARTGGAGTTAGVAVFVLLLVGVAIAAGFSTGDALVAGSIPSPDDVVPMRKGGAFTETAFWLSALAIFGYSFRVMEAIYRRQDVRLLSTYPISLRTQFGYRFIACALEVLGVVALMGLYFGAVYLQTGDTRAFAGLALGALGMTVCLTLGFAVQLGAGRSMLPSAKGGSKGSQDELLDRLNRMDAGGFAAAFYYAPAVALIASLVALLLLDLAVVGEFLERGTSRLFLVVTGVLVTTVVVATGLAVKWFVAYYPHLLARFYESDLVQLSTGYDYQQSVRHGARRGLFERGLAEGALPHFRKDALQYGRRYPMLRLLTIGFWIGVGITGYMGALPLWALSVLPLGLLAVVLAPWYRMAGRDLEPGVLEVLPVRESDVRSARTRAILREVLLLAAPSAIVVAAVGPYPESFIAGLAAGAMPMLAAPLCAFVATRQGATRSWALGTLLSLATAVVGYTIWGL